jgi:hypothetical protein
MVWRTGVRESCLNQADRGQREGLSHSYVRHTAPLGLLAPKVVEAICAGQQAVILSAERLKDLSRLPIEWDAQQRFLSN